MRSLTNPIKHYIKEMGGVGLLTREGEKDIAMRIEEAKGEIKQIVLSFPVTVKELLNAYAGLRMSKLNLRDITSEADEEDEADTEVRASEAKDLRAIGEAEEGLWPIEESPRGRRKGIAAGPR